jgi:hypothetical protein
MTKVSEKTMPVSAIMPDAIAEYKPIAAFTLTVEPWPGRRL